MMKQLMCVVMPCVLALSANAQANLPEFGVFTTQEKTMTGVDFDKGAEAVVIFDIGRAGNNDDYSLVVERRIRLKVLKEKGKERGNIEIPFFSKDNFENIVNIEGVVYSVDENGSPVITELKKADIYKQKENDRISMIRFAMPNVQVGSIIEYRYQSNNQHYGGLEDWFFQRDIPTMYSSFFLSVPANLEFTYNVHKSLDLPIKIDNQTKNGSVKFEMSNIAGLGDEPFMDAAKDFLQYVEFKFSGYMSRSGGKINYMSTWKESARELMTQNYFGSQLDKKLSNTDELIAGFKAIEPEEKRIEAIKQYIFKNISWNGYKLKFIDNSLKEVWEKKKGNSGEINLLMANLMRGSNLKAYPLLVSERKNGLVGTDFPILSQFNKTLVYIEAGGNKYVVDGTDEYTPIKLVPENVLNTKGFLVDVKEARVIDLNDEKYTRNNMINVVYEITGNNQLKGEAVTTSADYARIDRGRFYKQNKDKFVGRYFVSQYPGLSIDSFAVQQLDDELAPLEQYISFSAPLQSNGDYKLLPINQFTGLEVNPFLNDNRFSTINFGNKQNLNIIEQFVLPDNMKPEALPESVVLYMPEKSMVFGRTVSLDEGIVTVQLSLKINRPVYKASEYVVLKEFYKKMFAYLDEQIVLTSK